MQEAKQQQEGIHQGDRKSYDQPELRLYGRVAKLTNGGSGPTIEQADASTFRRPA